MAEPGGREGGMEEGLQAIQHGTPDQALLAAKRLGFNASSNVSGAQCLEEVGNVRAIMKVFDIPNLALEDRKVLHESMEKLVEARPRLAAHVVAACADPDPGIAFAALVCTKLLLGSPGDASVAMLEAGAVPAVMSALKHSNAYCRAAAASVAAGGYLGDDTTGSPPVLCVSPESAEALLEGGLVRALMDVIRTGPSDDAPAASSDVFSNVQVELRTGTQSVVLPNFEPALHACNALQLLIKKKGAASPDHPWYHVKTQVVTEVLQTWHVEDVLVQCLRQNAGALKEAPAKLILALLEALCDQSGVKSQGFCRNLLLAGLPEHLPSLIRPEQPRETGVLLSSLLKSIDSHGFGWISSQGLPALAAACAKCVEGARDGSRHHQMCTTATLCVVKILGGIVPEESLAVPLPEKCVQSLAGLMVSGPFTTASDACELVVGRGEGDTTGKVAKAAMAGGFVPGAFRLARERHLAPFPELLDKMVIRAVQWITASGKELYITQAINSGLLPFLETYLRMPEFQKDALEVCTNILKVPPALAKLRQAGFVPSVIRAADSLVELGKWVRKHSRVPGLLAEFVDAGLLEKMERARAEMFGQFSQQHEMATLIDELARMASGQPAPKSEAEAVMEALMRHTGSASAAAAGRARGQPREQTEEPEQRPADVQDDRARGVSTGAAGGEGALPEKDIPTKRSRGKRRLACDQCGKSREDGVQLQMCSGCGTAKGGAVYCGRECQRRHWPKHKAECIKMQRELQSEKEEVS